VIKTYAWRIRVGNDVKYLYRLQADGVNNKTKDKLLREVEGWTDVGSWTKPGETDSGLLFQREFDTEEEWIAWAMLFPYELSELSSCSNNVKPIKLGINSNAPKRKPGRPRKTDPEGKPRPIIKAKRGRPKRRICGHCGDRGHNRRTCPVLAAGGEIVVKAKKKKVKCGKCGKMGHNARTCNG